jgi:protein gp37
MQSWISRSYGTGTFEPKPLPNVWLGVSAENQARADERIPLLLQCPASVRFVSIEPMLGSINLYPYILHQRDRAPSEIGRISDYGPALDWVIAGGETGPGARRMNPDWVRSIRDQCKAADIPFFFKAWGKHVPIFQDAANPHLLDGKKWRQWPDDYLD